jgi:hypothetical protein
MRDLCVFAALPEMLVVVRSSKTIAGHSDRGDRLAEDGPAGRERRLRRAAVC